MHLSSIRTLALVASMTACTAPSADDEADFGETTESPKKTLLSLDLGGGRGINFLDLGDNQFLIDEHGPVSSPTLINDPWSSLSEVFLRVRPGDAVPKVLADADALAGHPAVSTHAPGRVASTGIGVAQQAISAKDFRAQGGCDCPFGDDVLPICELSRTGNRSEMHDGEWARFRVGHLSGNGVDMFVKVDGKTTKFRIDPGQFHAESPRGQKVLAGDIDNIDMGLEVKGAEGDVYHFGACWASTVDLWPF